MILVYCKKSTGWAKSNLKFLKNRASAKLSFSDIFFGFSEKSEFELEKTMGKFRIRKKIPKNSILPRRDFQKNLRYFLPTLYNDHLDLVDNRL